MTKTNKNSKSEVRNSKQYLMTNKKFQIPNNKFQTIPNDQNPKFKTVLNIVIWNL